MGRIEGRELVKGGRPGQAFRLGVFNSLRRLPGIQRRSEEGDLVSTPTVVGIIESRMVRFQLDNVLRHVPPEKISVQHYATPPKPEASQPVASVLGGFDFGNSQSAVELDRMHI